jgi:major membrane immunogen (membrane-anchored lipoprotein)
MNRPLLALILASTLALSACGADEKTIEGITYGTYGIVNKEEMRNPNIQYEISGWSIFWSVIFCETIIVPVYFIGWDLYQPVTKKDANWVPGQVK